MDGKTQMIMEQIENADGRIPISYGRKTRIVAFKCIEETLCSTADVGHLVGQLKKLDKRVKELEKTHEKVIVLREITMQEAESEIQSFIKGNSKFDDLEIVEKLNIPIEKVDEVLEKLERKGIIRAK